MTTDSSPDSLNAYLSTIVGRAPATAFLELRHRVGPQQLAAEFFPTADVAAAADAIRRRAPHTDVYVGCAPRSRHSGRRDAIREVWVLWAECDGAQAARAARAFDPRPPLVIASGSGPNCHAYWPLRDPLSGPEAELANLRLAQALGADLVCFDAARILRPPGSWNHKRRPPTPVATLRHERGVAFRADEVVARTPSVDGAAIRDRWEGRGARAGTKDPLLAVPPAVYVEELLGVRVGRGRKVKCPFHAEERPSLHVYPSAARGWCCFSCGRGGSIYDLAAGLWDLGTRGREFAFLRSRLEERFRGELARRHERSGAGR